MTFAAIPGHNALKHKLIQNVQSGKLAHALLFLGDEGSANLTMAMALAQYVNCANPTETDSCGTCPSCRFMEKKAHPDVHFSFPVVGTKVIARDHIEEWRNTLIENPYISEFEWYKKIRCRKQTR